MLFVVPPLLMGMAALPAITMLPRPSIADVPATSAVNTTGLAVTDQVREIDHLAGHHVAAREVASRRASNPSAAAEQSNTATSSGRRAFSPARGATSPS